MFHIPNTPTAGFYGAELQKSWLGSNEGTYSTKSPLSTCIIMTGRTCFCHHLFHGNRLDRMSEMSFESLVLSLQVACLRANKLYQILLQCSCLLMRNENAQVLFLNICCLAFCHNSFFFFLKREGLIFLNGLSSICLSKSPIIFVKLFL